MGDELLTSPHLGARVHDSAEVRENTLMTVDKEDDKGLQSAMVIRLELIQEDQRQHRKMKCCIFVLVCYFVLLGWCRGAGSMNLKSDRGLWQPEPGSHSYYSHSYT